MTDRTGVRGTSVLVAGASRGIGAAIAVAFAEAGAARVTVLGRSGDALKGVAADVRRSGAEARATVCDLTDTAASRAAVAGAGPVDVLVLNAGTNQPEPFVDVEEATYDRLFDLNVRAGFFVAQAVVRGMQQAGRGGAIVFVSSQMGHVGAPDRTVYCASKHAVEGLVKAMAVELAVDRIRVVSVAPTFVRTPLTAPWLDDPAVGPGLLEQIPLGRYGTAEEVAAAVVWAASREAGMLTGTSLRLDGGWTAR